jgi:hypothetical protein
MSPSPSQFRPLPETRSGPGVEGGACPRGIMIVVVISLSGAQEQKKDNDFSY